MSSILELLLLIPVILVSLMAHEVAHGYIAAHLGDPTARIQGRLTANPLKHLDPLGSLMFLITYMVGGFVFGWAKPVPVNPYYFRDHQRGMAFVGIAGPLTNFLLAVVIASILNLLAPDNATFQTLLTGDLLTRVFFLAFQVNVVLGLFNLLPVPPLDGSRVLGGFLSPGAYARWTALDRYGILFIFFILFLLQDVFFWLLGNGFFLVSELLLRSYF